MKTLTAAMISASALAIVPAVAQAAAEQDVKSADLFYAAPSDEDYLVLGALAGPETDTERKSRISAEQIQRFSITGIDQSSALRTFQAGSYGTLYTSISASPARRALRYDYPGFDLENPMQSAYWLDNARERASTVTMGYAWHGVAVESSALALADETSGGFPGTNTPKFDVRSARLSYNPAPNWVLRLSRGTVSTLDQLVPNDEVRRTAVAATYTMPFQRGDWQTTVAWGRNARKFRESTMGYLLESTVRFSGTHSVFGRVEQVGSDGLMREDESIQRQFFKMNRISFGYFYDLRTTGPLHLDVGALVSRHMVPGNMEASYGSDPTAYMMFVRVKMR